MADLTLSTRLLNLSTDPRSVSALWADVYDALERDQNDAGARRAAAGLSSEATRLALSWMGTGRTDRLGELVASLQAAMVEKDAMDPLAGVPSAPRFAARFHDLARVVVTYEQTNNAARHVGALAGRRRETWRKIVAWAYHREEPFSATDILDAGFYAARRGSAYETLNQLAAYGLVEKQPEDGLYRLTWDGRSACRAHSSPDEIQQDADRSLAAAQTESLRAQLEEANQRLRDLAQEHESLRDAHSTLEKKHQVVEALVESFGTSHTTPFLGSASHAGWVRESIDIMSGLVASSEPHEGIEASFHIQDCFGEHLMWATAAKGHNRRGDVAGYMRTEPQRESHPPQLVPARGNR